MTKLRGHYNANFFRWLHDKDQSVGVRGNLIVFRVVGPGGALAGLHQVCLDGKLRFSQGAKVHPLVFGDMTGVITEVHLGESRWDMYALASVTGWHLKTGVRFISTLGAGKRADAWLQQSRNFSTSRSWEIGR